jgi:hypothetical protein
MNPSVSISIDRGHCLSSFRTPITKNSIFSHFLHLSHSIIPKQHNNNKKALFTTQKSLILHSNLQKLFSIYLNQHKNSINTLLTHSQILYSTPKKTTKHSKDKNKAKALTFGAFLFSSCTTTSPYMSFSLPSSLSLSRFLCSNGSTN